MILQSEDKYFHQLKNQTERHMEESIFMLSCQLNTNGSVVCYELDAKNPEYRFVKTHFTESMQNSGEENRIFSIYKIYNSTVLKHFERNLKKSSSNQSLR